MTSLLMIASGKPETLSALRTRASVPLSETMTRTNALSNGSPFALPTVLNVIMLFGSPRLGKTFRRSDSRSTQRYIEKLRKLK